MLAIVFMMKLEADMSFGKRGVQDAPISRPAFATMVPATPDADIGEEAGVFGSLLGGRRSDDFDINLSYMQPYGEGKSVIVLVLMWLFLGGAGAHRFYLGHNMFGLAILLINALFAVSATVAILSGVVSIFKTTVAVQPMWGWWFGVFLTLSLWILIDGIYVICRTLSAKVGS